MIKSRILRRWFSLVGLFISFTCLPSHAEVKEARQFDQEKMEAFRHNPEFNYTEDYATTNFLSGWMAYLMDKLSFLLGNPNLVWLGPIIFRVLLLLAIIAAILIIIRLKFGPLLTKKSGSFAHASVAFANVVEEDYQKLLQESIKNRTFKLAVRYLFLSALKMLEQQKRIQLKQWKAPYDYLNELPENKKEAFKQLTDLFENTWYGDYVPDHEAVALGLQLHRQLENA